MKDLPADSVISLEQEAGLEKVVMSYPSSLSSRLGSALIFGILISVALYFWLDAMADLVAGLIGFDEVMQLLFTTLILIFAGLMARTVLRRRVPESIVVVGDGIIHDSGVDPHRRTPLEKDAAGQREQTTKARKRMSFSAEEAATLTRTNIPYDNRLCIEAEELAKPVFMVSGLHTRHRVDPLDFEDPIARHADWEPLVLGGGSSYRLIRSGGRAAFQATTLASAFALVFAAVGVLILATARNQLVADGMEIGAEFVFLFLVGSVFLLTGLYLVRQTFAPIVFSLRKGDFRRGWSSASIARLADIHGLQLLSFALTGTTSHRTGYELNLLMQDGTRHHVLCHGNVRALKEDVALLGRFLDRPVFDGIRTLD